MSQDMTVEERLEGVLQVTEDVWYWHERTMSATTFPAFSTAMNQLNDAVVSLASWHPNWDYEHGVITGVIEETED